MNIELPTQPTATNKTEKNVSAPVVVQKDNSDKSFKQELEAMKPLPQETPKVELPQVKLPEQKLPEIKPELPKTKDVEVKLPESVVINKPENIPNLPIDSNIINDIVSKNNKQKEPVKTKTKDPIESKLQALVDINTKLLGLNQPENKAPEHKVEKTVRKDNSFKELDMKSIKMDDNDALFFANLVQNNDLTNKDLNFKNMVTETPEVQKSVQVSATLMTSLQEAIKNNQPLRIDFDKDVAVIIKVDSRTGKISAEFIPGDKAVENYLRNNIPLLKQRFDDQDLSYNELNYRQSKHQQNENQRNKEKKDE